MLKVLFYIGISLVLIVIASLPVDAKGSKKADNLTPTFNKAAKKTDLSDTFTGSTYHRIELKKKVEIPELRLDPPGTSQLDNQLQNLSRQNGMKPVGKHPITPEFKATSTKPEQ